MAKYSQNPHKCGAVPHDLTLIVSLLGLIVWKCGASLYITKYFTQSSCWTKWLIRHFSPRAVYNIHPLWRVPSLSHAAATQRLKSPHEYGSERMKVLCFQASLSVSNICPCCRFTVNKLSRGAFWFADWGTFCVICYSDEIWLRKDVNKKWKALGMFFSR